MSYHNRVYEYEPDSYYDQGAYYRQDAGAPSSSSSYDRGVPPPRVRRPENLPNKPSSSNSNSITPRSAGISRAQSPPRKISRTESSGGSSNGGFSHRRENTQTNLRAVEKATIREVPVPDAFAAVKSLVSLLQHQQDMTRELQEIQTKNAAIIRLSKREDISKENKEKGDKAVEEVVNAKRRESNSWKKVEEKLEMIIVDLLLHYMEDEKAAVRDFVSSQWKAIGTGSDDVEVMRPLQRQERVQSKGPASMRASTAEDGEIVESPAVPIAPLPILLSSAGTETSLQTTSTTDKGKGKTNANALSIKIRDRLEEMESQVMESHERMDQIEALVTELVRAEVATYVDAARVRKEERKERAAVAAAAAQTATNGAHYSSDSAMDMSMSVDKTPTMAPYSVNANTNGVIPPTEIPSNEIYARSKDDFLTREQVDALMEGVRQSMREEFHLKLFEQSKDFQRTLQETSAALVARTTNNHQAVSAMITKHYEVLENHGQCLNRHEQLWVGTLGTFSHIPRPQNAPR